MGLELDEYIYGKFVTYFKKKKRVDPAILGRTVFLNDIKQPLTIIARAVTGEAVSLFPAEREGGYKNNNYFLPISFAEFESKESNKLFYYYRTLYLCIQKRLNLNWNIGAEQSDQLSRQKAFETSQNVLDFLFNEYPSLKPIHDLGRNHFVTIQNKGVMPDFSWLYGKWMLNVNEQDENSPLQNFNDLIKQASEKQPNTILHAKATETVKTIEVDKKQQEDYVMTHNFEKVETADEFNGSWRDFDGSDELEDHQAALEELNMKYTVRVNDTTHSVYQADFIENTTVSESAEVDFNGFHFKYNEWDYSKSNYKIDFCKLYPKSQLKTNPDYYKKTISTNAVTLNGLRKMLTHLNNKLQQKKRQVQGDEFDIDAITDLFVDVHSKHTPSENIYISRRKKEKDISLLILLDISLSSDSYAANKRVIDVEKEVCILFGEILNEFNVDFCIDSFYSKTRNYSTYLTIKEFNETWNSAKNKIGAVEPGGYTRIGTALRHAGARLDTRDSKNKWIILISDGKPNDYDKYEGKYGINDVKQALMELNQRNINSYALAIEASAKYYLPQMFGQSHYQILTTPVELINALVKLFEKIKHQQ